MIVRREADGYDLNHGVGDSVDNPKSAEPAAAQACELAAEQLADCGIVEDVAQSGTNLSLQVLGGGLE